MACERYVMPDITATAICVVEGCDRLASLSDVTEGELWVYRANYCSKCFEQVLEGATPKLDASRLVITRVETPDGCSGRFAALREMLEASL